MRNQFLLSKIANTDIKYLILSQLLQNSYEGFPGGKVNRNYIKYIPSSHLTFLKTELTVPESDYRSKAYSLPLFLYSCLFLSHDIRRDVNVILVLVDDRYQVIQISSNMLRNMRPDFRSVLFVLTKAIKLLHEKQFNESYFPQLGIKIYNSLNDFKEAFNDFSLIIANYKHKFPPLTSLPNDKSRYLIQIGIPSSVEPQMESYFPLLGVISVPTFFDLNFMPSVLNIELDRSQIFDKTSDSTIA